MVAVVAAPGVAKGMPDSSAALLLEDSLSQLGNHSVTGLARVRGAVGLERHAAIATEFARTGRLVNDGLQTVMATPLTARRGLLVRLEKNETDLLEPAAMPWRDLDGESPPDRQTVVLASRRKIRVSATLIELGTGSVRWQRAWTAAPVARTEYVRYTGSSFTGSVSASLANSVVNGLGGPAAPPPPELEVALQAVFRELAETLPLR